MMLTLQTTLVQLFLVLNTTETNTNRRAVSQCLGPREIQLRSQSESVGPEHRTRGALGGHVRGRGAINMPGLPARPRRPWPSQLSPHVIRSFFI